MYLIIKHKDVIKWGTYKLTLPRVFCAYFLVENKVKILILFIFPQNQANFKTKEGSKNALTAPLDSWPRFLISHLF